MQNVVVDASVVVSAALKPSSIPFQALVTAVRSDRLCMSEAVADEIGGVLARPGFRRRLASRDQATGIAVLLQSAAMVETHESVSDCRDAKDDKYLELALAAGAWAIVSGDADLLVLDPWRGVRIVTPAEYVRLVGEREGLNPP